MVSDKYFLSMGIGLMLMSLIGSAFAEPPKDACAWALTFQDEFQETALNLSKWTPLIHSDEHLLINGNQELQAYEASSAQMEQGELHLRAEAKPSVWQGKTFPYTSGMVNTRNKFSQQYGYFETRVKLPKGNGMWPAFWLLPTTGEWPPEIDVFEFLGRLPDMIYLSRHYPSKGLPDSKNIEAQGRHYVRKFRVAGMDASHTIDWQGKDFTRGYHVFAADWQPERIDWYLDGKKISTLTGNIPQEPMYVILNLAVGGTWPGNPDKTTRFPQQMAVDYVRVYQRQCSK